MVIESKSPHLKCKCVDVNNDQLKGHMGFTKIILDFLRSFSLLHPVGNMPFLNIVIF